MNKDLTAFLSALKGEIGEEWVNTNDETLYRYGENTMPEGDRRPAAVVYPGHTQEIQKIVRLANKFKVNIHPVSQGNNMSLGTRSAVGSDNVIIDLGRRMNRITEINDTLHYCEIEPGVSYQMLHDELVRRGNKMMIDCTSGPPQGSVLGNATDRGAGYTPYADHFGNTCGLEVVLANGEIIHTGDYLPGRAMWHVSKYTFGPSLDALFVQSNLGIVTRAGVWLMPRPPVSKSFHFTFPDDEDLTEIIDLARPLKMTGMVPTLFRVANDLWLIGEEEQNPEYAASGGRKSLSSAGRRALQREYGLGAWTASGALYGASEQALDATLERVKKHFMQSGKARYISHEELSEYPGLPVANSVFNGIPSPSELRQLKWRPGGGVTCFTPGSPMVGSSANELQVLARQILDDFGLEYVSMWVCAARFARGLHNIIFNRRDPDESQRANDAYRALATAFHGRGYAVGRAPIDYHGQHAADRSEVVNKVNGQIKEIFDPNHILSPGRYGVV